MSPNKKGEAHSKNTLGKKKEGKRKHHNQKSPIIFPAYTNTQYNMNMLTKSNGASKKVLCLCWGACSQQLSLAASTQSHTSPPQVERWG